MKFVYTILLFSLNGIASTNHGLTPSQIENHINLNTSVEARCPTLHSCFLSRQQNSSLQEYLDDLEFTKKQLDTIGVTSKVK